MQHLLETRSENYVKAKSLKKLKQLHKARTGNILPAKEQKAKIVAVCKILKYKEKKNRYSYVCRFLEFKRRSWQGTFSGVKDLAGRRNRRLGTAKIYGAARSGPRRSSEKKENLNTHVDLSLLLSLFLVCVRGINQPRSLTVAGGRNAERRDHLIAEEAPE